MFDTIDTGRGRIFSASQLTFYVKKMKRTDGD